MQKPLKYHLRCPTRNAASNTQRLKPPLLALVYQPQNDVLLDKEAASGPRLPLSKRRFDCPSSSNILCSKTSRLAFPNGIVSPFATCGHPQSFALVTIPRGPCCLPPAVDTSLGSNLKFGVARRCMALPTFLPMQQWKVGVLSYAGIFFYSLPPSSKQWAPRSNSFLSNGKAPLPLFSSSSTRAPRALSFALHLESPLGPGQCDGRRARAWA